MPDSSMWSHKCIGATKLLNVTHPGGLMPISIQYAGFQVQLHGRDYSYYVLDPPSASRHFTFTIPHQAFAEPAQSNDRLAMGLVDRRLERAHEKRAGDANALEALIKDARTQRVEVELDVRKFRH